MKPDVDILICFVLLSLCMQKFQFLLQALNEPRFRAVDKIKTIGSTYMGAIGLMPEMKIQVGSKQLVLGSIFRSYTVFLFVERNYMSLIAYHL